MSARTPLYDEHQKLGAHLVVFADSWLPVRYQSEKEEHLAVRSSLGLFDVSHMGEFSVQGQNALNFLNSILTNNLSKLSPGRAHYSLMLNHEGGIIDDLIVYCYDQEHFMLCVNAANISIDWQWLCEHAKDESKVNLENVSSNYAQLALQGPKALELLAAISKQSLPSRFCFSTLSLHEISCLVARTGYTGEDGVEIFVAPAKAALLWQLLLNKGHDLGIKPCGLAARDSLRLEAGLLLHGTDIDQQTTPLEAKLSFAVDFDKNFIGKEALLLQKAKGLSRILIGFRLAERGIARHGFFIQNENQENIGLVSSGSWPPTQESGIGLGYVSPRYATVGTSIYICVRERMIKAHVEKPRFLKH